MDDEDSDEEDHRREDAHDRHRGVLRHPDEGQGSNRDHDLDVGRTHDGLRVYEDETHRADMLKRAVVVLPILESIDGITLTPEEMLAAAVFFAFASRNVVEVVGLDMVSIMRRMGCNWYMPVACSNINLAQLRDEERDSGLVGEQDHGRVHAPGLDSAGEHVQVHAHGRLTIAGASRTG